MNNQHEEHNMGSTLWQSQALEAPRISLEYVRHQAEKLNADFRKENYLLYFSVLASLCLWGWVLFFPKPDINVSFSWVLRVSALFVCAGVLYYVIWVRQWAPRKLSVQSNDKVRSTLEQYRKELERRRDYYLKSFQLWPMVPAVVVLFVGGMLYDNRPGALEHYGKSAVLLAIAIFVAYLYSRIGSRKFQRELDALATMDNKSGSQ